MTAHVPPHSQWPGGQPPQWGPPPQPPRKKRRWPWVLGAVVLLFVLIGVANAGNDSPRPANTPPPAGVPSGVDPERYRAPQPAPPPAPPPAAPVSPSGPLTTFGSGTYEVGTGDGQVAPGKYKTAGPGEDSYGSCYWARLKDTDGDLGSIIANGNTEGPAVVTIGKSDGAFETRCTWTKAG